MESKSAPLEQAMSSILSDVWSFSQHCKVHPRNVTMLTEEEDRRLYIGGLQKIATVMMEIAQMSTAFIDSEKRKYYEAAIVITKKKFEQLKEKQLTKKPIPQKAKQSVIRPYVPKCSVRDLFEKMQVRIPKVSVSAYYLFYLLKTKELQSLGSQLTIKEKQTNIASMWKELSEAEKKEFTDLQAQIKIRYNTYETLSKKEEEKLMRSNNKQKPKRQKKNGKSVRKEEEKTTQKSSTQYCEHPSQQSQLLEDDLLSNSLESKAEQATHQFIPSTNIQV